jgi:opacity protein-like surface antigen
MKKIFRISVVALLTIFMIVPVITFAQGKVEISPFAGYMFGGSLNFYEGKLKADNNLNYGVAVDFKLAEDTQIELMWTQMGTTAQFEPYSGYYDFYDIKPFDMNVGYIQIGGVREMNLDQIRPFGVFTLGTTYFIPKDVTYINDEPVDVESQWKFSMTLGAGAKIWFTDRVGIRLQGNLMMPMFWSSTGFAVGTGGSGFYVGGGTSMVQGNFTGGLIFALGD